MNRSIFRTAALLLITWLILLGILSIQGFFSNFSSLPPRLPFALLLPLPLVLLFVRSHAMPPPLRVFHNQPDCSLLTKFPFIYLPGVLVPLAYTLHILSLRQWVMYRAAAPIPGKGK